MIVNLTQHPASPEQVAAGVVDLPTAHRALLAQSLTVDTLPARQEISDRCANIAALAVHNGLGGDDGDDPQPGAAMIGGAPWMMAELERALLDMGVPSVYAFSVRESVEQTQPDGSVRKVNVFRHAGFVDAATPPAVLPPPGQRGSVVMLGDPGPAAPAGTVGTWARQTATAGMAIAADELQTLACALLDAAHDLRTHPASSFASTNTGAAA